MYAFFPTYIIQAKNINEIRSDNEVQQMKNLKKSIDKDNMKCAE